jgi:hypothetical protein
VPASASALNALPILSQLDISVIALVIVRIANPRCIALPLFIMQERGAACSTVHPAVPIIFSPGNKGSDVASLVKAAYQAMV